MIDFGLKFHHYGLAVNKDEQALIFLRGLAYTFGEVVYDPEQNVNLRQCRAEGLPTVEIVMRGEGDGPITKILKNRNELIYHTCYETSDLELSFKKMKKAGLQAPCVVKRKPAILFDGRHVSFYQLMGFGLIEILEPQ